MIYWLGLSAVWLCVYGTIYTTENLRPLFRNVSAKQFGPSKLIDVEIKGSVYDLIFPNENAIAVDPSGLNQTIKNVRVVSR